MMLYGFPGNQLRLLCFQECSAGRAVLFGRGKHEQPGPPLTLETLQKAEQVLRFHIQPTEMGGSELVHAEPRQNRP